MPPSTQVSAPSPRRRGAARQIAAVLVVVTVFPLTITGSSVALSAIQSDLGARVIASQWVVNAYSATFAAFLLPMGAIADRWNRRAVCAGGITLFAAAGVSSAMASGVLMLDAARAVAGIGAAAAVTGGVALLSTALRACLAWSLRVHIRSWMCWRAASPGGWSRMSCGSWWSRCC
ncbi:MFS transporter, partial [Frankia sp. R82]|uniref:MFS transporter n=1 Tax=Frankia sp. R82 TaxID=2950553 RepID=UPI0035AC00CA